MEAYRITWLFVEEPTPISSGLPVVVLDEPDTPPPVEEVPADVDEVVVIGTTPEDEAAVEEEATAPVVDTPLEMVTT